MHPLKLIKIKNPFGFLQSNPKILTEWVEPFLFLKKHVFVKHLNTELMLMMQYFYFMFQAEVRKKMQNARRSRRYSGRDYFWLKSTFPCRWIRSTSSWCFSSAVEFLAMDQSCTAANQTASEENYWFHFFLLFLFQIKANCRTTNLTGVSTFSRGSISKAPS